MKFSIQFDYHGRHRIVMDDGVGGIHTGEWAGYRSLATLTWENESNRHVPARKSSLCRKTGRKILRSPPCQGMDRR